MNSVLSTKQKLFITRMAENQEQAKWGFEILLKRQDFAEFFDALKDAQLFSPENNSNPVPAEDPNYVQIPYWSALDYLEAVAKQTGVNNNIHLAQKVLAVIRSVSSYRDSEGRHRDNYHTYRKFAEILGLIPTTAITTEDINLIPIWLSSKYDRGMVAHALDMGALGNLLKSDIPGDWEKACIILSHCTTINWIDEKGLSRNRRKPVSIVDDYWLKKLIKHHAGTFGAKAGKAAAQIFRGRISELFDEKFGDSPTYWSRPAVEDHSQNHSWDGLVNGIVEGFRDILLSWVDSEPGGATAFVAEILEDKTEMVRRIAIYVLGQRWTVLSSLYSNMIDSELFDSRNIHELYHLLNDRFTEFSETDKAATLDAIRNLPPPDHEDKDHILRHTQRNWLSAIVGKGNASADNWFRELNADQSLGKLSEHPDFHSYMETSIGPGPSPYSTQDLLAFTEDGSLIERLNDFQQSDEWRGPSIKALVNSLEEVVGIKPPEFIRLLPLFLNAKRPYQYGVINGFKHLWDMPSEKQQSLDWNVAWKMLIDFFDRLISNPEFWAEEVVQNGELLPTRDWIPPIIAEFLRAGTRDDNKAYSPEFLPAAFSLIKILLENLESDDDAKEDAMSQAINSSKGKAIEALFSHTLRVCRISDEKYGDHADAWIRIKPAFDTELQKCENDNYEFSTLAAAYLTNIEYISRSWLEANMPKIFPQNFPINFICAIDGLAYASATRSIYALLIKNAILDRALRLELSKRKDRERIIERIALAYLWGDELLDSPRFTYLFESGQIEDLEEASSFLYSVRDQKLNEEQIERILCFFEKCVVWVKELPEPPKSLLSELSRLACYVTTIGDREVNLLLAVANYVKVGFNTDIFIEELDRLVEQDPEKVNSVLKKVLETFEPVYDYEDRLKNLVIKLATKGMREDVLLHIDRMRKLPGIEQLFKQISSAD